MQIKTIAHHQQTCAQPVPELQFTANLPPGLLLSVASYGLGYPLGLLSWLCPLLMCPRPKCWVGHVRSIKGLVSLQALLSNN